MKNKIDEVRLEGVYANPEEMGITLGWEGDEGYGLINFRFYYPETEEQDYFIAIDSELMGREFVKQVLCQMVDNAKLTHEIMGEERYKELKEKGRI